MDAMGVMELGQQAATTGLIAKAAVDIYRWSPLPSPWWALPLSAFLFAIVGSLVLTYAARVEMDGPNIAKAVLVGFLGGVSAIVATEIHKFVRRDETNGELNQ